MGGTDVLALSAKTVVRATIAGTTEGETTVTTAGTTVAVKNSPVVGVSNKRIETNSGTLHRGRVATRGIAEIDSIVATPVSLLSGTTGNIGLLLRGMVNTTTVTTGPETSC